MVRKGIGGDCGPELVLTIIIIQASVFQTDHLNISKAEGGINLT